MVRGLISDAEWMFFEPFVATKTGRPTDYRRVLDGIFWVTRTGAPWRDLPEELGKWNSVYQQFRRWSLAGLWDALLDALAGSGAAPKTIQMIDSTVIRAHHQAAGAKGGLKTRLLAVRAAVLRAKFRPRRSVALCAAQPHRALLQQAEKRVPGRNPIRQNR